MAHFDLDDNHRLRSDSRQWILEKRGKLDKNGEETWKALHYHSTIENAVNQSYQYFLRKSDADSIIAFKQDAKRIFDNLVSVLSPIADIKPK